MVSFLSKKMRKRKKSWSPTDSTAKTINQSKSADTNGNYKKIDNSSTAMKESLSWMQVPRSNSFSKREWQATVISLYEDQLLCQYKNKNSDSDICSNVIKTRNIESLIPKESHSCKERIFLIEIRSRHTCSETTLAFKNREERDAWMIAFLTAKSQSILRSSSK